MFANCTSLTETPELPATIVGDYAYGYMFAKCSSLTEIPVLPANSVGLYAYHQMFIDCSNMSGTINLPATNLSAGCYEKMLYGCSNITGINVNFTEWEVPYVENVDGVESITNVIITSSWVTNISPSGTFTCPNTLDISKIGSDYIPENWTISVK